MQRTLLFFACLLVCSTSMAQQYPFVHYGPKEGLADNRVHKIFQDSKNRMYFLTYEGLSVYDGTRFTNYTTENGLAINLVNDILECGEDSLLLAVNAPQLQVLVRGEVKVPSIHNNVELPVVNHFCRGSNGNIYLATDHGLYVLNGNQISKLPFDRLIALNTSAPLMKVLYLGEFLLILGSPNDYYTDRNLFLYDLRSSEVTCEYDKVRITDIAYGPDSIIYISTTAGIEIINPDKLKKRKLQTSSMVPRLPVAFNSGSMLFSDAEKNLWITHNTLGVIRLGYDKKIQNFSQANGISSSLISYVFRDSESNLWFANEEKGVDKLTSERIEIYPADPKFPKTYINGTSTGDTVLLLDRKNNSITLLAGANEKSIPLPQDWSPTIISMRKERLYAWNWLTLYTADLDKNDRLTRIRKYNIQRPEKFGLYNGTFDPEGNLLLTCNTKLILFTVDGQFQYYQLDDFTDKAIVDQNGRIWAITRSDNLYVYERAKTKFSDSLHLLKVFSKEMAGGFRTITCDRMNRIWIGTRNKGVWCIQADKNLNIIDKKQFAVKDGLTNNFALDIQCDIANNLWVSSPSGLDRLLWVDKKTVIENVTRANNIYQYVIRTVVRPNGEIIGLTSTGNIIKVKPRINFQVPFEPRLLITNFRVNNIKADSFYSGIRLKYTENNLSFDIAAPSFTDEQRIKYSYCINTGNNYHCSEYSSTSTINLSGLNPGEYELWLRVSFPGKMYPEKQLRFAFSITPPWWKTTWFRLILLSTLLLFGIVAVRSYYGRKFQKQKQAFEKQQAIERERSRIATDMHDDLGAGLTRIKFITENMIEQSHDPALKSDVLKLKTSSNELVEKMGEIIWAMNEKNNSLEDLLFYLRSYTVDYCTENKLSCDFIVPESIPSMIIDGQTRRNIFLVLKESLHNIVKHAGAENVTVHVVTDKKLVLTVTDDGKGFSSPPNTNGNGMLSMRQRAAGLNGKLSVYHDGPFTVQLEIPLV